MTTADAKAALLAYLKPRLSDADLREASGLIAGFVAAAVREKVGKAASEQSILESIRGVGDSLDRLGRRAQTRP